MNELTRLSLSPSELKRLSHAGITSIQQLAMANPTMTGLTDSKADAAIRSARVYIATENTLKVEVPASKQEVVISVKHVDSAIRQSILTHLDVSTKHCDVAIEGTTIRLSQKYGYASQFKQIREHANQWRELIAAQHRARDARDGIHIKKGDLLKFAKEKGFDGFANNVFRGIVGNETMKRALSLSLFSTFDEPVHTLILGDPGSAKTLARDIIVGNFTGVTTVGANTTRSGLVCNLATGEPGALASADQKIALIDEFDKISGEDVQACYELLSNGRCSVHSGRIHQDIASKFILIAFANPATATFVGNPTYAIGMESTLLSRFAFIIRTEMLKTEERHKLFTEIFHGNLKIQNLDPEYDQWVKLSRHHEPKMKAKPQAVDSFTRSFLRIVDDLVDTPLRRDLRMAGHARRIAFALARSEFTDVTDKTLERALALVQANVRQWDE